MGSGRTIVSSDLRAHVPTFQTSPLTPRPAPRKRYTFSEWLVNFLAADLEDYEAELARANNGDDGGLGGLDEWNSAGGGGVGDEYYGDGWEDYADDDMLETLIILGLAATLAFLVWFRQQRQMRERREREAQQAAAAGGGGQPQAEPDRGLFPAPGDPEVLNWAGGGVGH